MRRFKQQMTREETLALFKEHTSGVLSLTDGKGQPYGVPLSYAQDDKGLYFHWAKEGLKVDLFKENNRASFTVIFEDTIISESYTSRYKSGIVLGSLEILEGEEAREAMTLLIEKYSGSQPKEEKEMKAHCPAALMVRLTLDEVSGKKAKNYD